MSRTDFADIQNKKRIWRLQTMAKTIFEELGSKYERLGNIRACAREIVNEEIINV